MKILFVSFMASAPWGGSEELWSGTALHLQAAGHEVSASVQKWPEPSRMVARLRTAGVAIHERDWGRPSMLQRSLHRLGGKIAPDQNEVSLGQWIDRWRPDFICASNGVAIDRLEGLERIARSGIPWCNIAHCGIEWCWPLDQDIARAAETIRSARSWFFVAERNRQLFETQWGFRLERAEIVRNPVKIRNTPALPWPHDDGTFRLACVARHDPVCKGQDILLEVLAQEKWQNRPAVVSLFGDGARSLSIRHRIERLKLARRVTIHGHVDLIEDIWRTHHALVLPSRHEGLPLALVEAALCGRPAIVTDVGGNTELTHDGATGFVAAAPTVAHLDEALERAWSRRADWPALGLAAREHASSLIPADPVATFAERLLELAAARG